MTGVFFEGIPGLQFASPTAFQKLQRIGRPDSIYWMNATDPASLCGISLESLRGTLPPRLPPPISSIGERISSSSRSAMGVSSCFTCHLEIPR